MYTIRPYTDADYSLIESWWSNVHQHAPTKEMHPKDSTLILEVEDKPAVCLSIILTNTKEFVYFENFIADPKMENRKTATAALVEYATGFTKGLGYKRIIGLTNEEKLAKRYNELGFAPNKSVLYCVSKEVK